MKLFFKILMWFCIVLTVLFTIGLIFVSSYGGDSPEWKRQVKDIASEVTGRNVEIGKMNDARLFPRMMFDGEYILVGDPFLSIAREEFEEREALKPEESSLIIEKIHFSVPFWTIFWGTPALEYLNVESIVNTDQKSRFVEFIKLSWEDQQNPKILMKGAYDDVDYEGTFQLTRGWGGAILSNTIPFEFTMNDIPLSGVLNPYQGGLDISNFEIKIDDRLYQGQITMPEGEALEIDLKLNGAQEILIRHTKDFTQETEFISYNRLEVVAVQNMMGIICGLYPRERFSLQYREEPPQMVGCQETDEDITPANPAADPVVTEEPTGE